MSLLLEDLNYRKLLHHLISDPDYKTFKFALYGLFNSCTDQDGTVISEGYFPEKLRFQSESLDVVHAEMGRIFKKELKPIEAEMATDQNVPNFHYRDNLRMEHLDGLLDPVINAHFLMKRLGKNPRFWNLSQTQRYNFMTGFGNRRFNQHFREFLNHCEPFMADIEKQLPIKKGKYDKEVEEALSSPEMDESIKQYKEFFSTIFPREVDTATCDLLKKKSLEAFGFSEECKKDDTSILGNDTDKLIQTHFQSLVPALGLDSL